MNRFPDVRRRAKTDPVPARRYSSLAEFYPHYLSEHSHPVSRALHVAGTSSAIALAFGAAVTKRPRLLVAAPVVGYGVAWLGHFLFERNKPATFRQPMYSLACDFLMLRDVLRGRLDLSSTDVERRHGCPKDDKAHQLHDRGNDAPGGR